MKSTFKEEKNDSLKRKNPHFIPVSFLEQDLTPRTSRNRPIVTMFTAEVQTPRIWEVTPLNNSSKKTPDILRGLSKAHGNETLSVISMETNNTAVSKGRLKNSRSNYRQRLD